MRNFTLLIFGCILCSLSLKAQQGFQSITNLSPISITADTGEKPQSKVWFYGGKHWAVLPSSGGTYLWRLDGTTWVNTLKISNKIFSKADCKLYGNTVHILLLTGEYAELISLEFNFGSAKYNPWTQRGSTVDVWLDDDVETATLDIDGTGRMWMAFNGDDDTYDFDFNGVEDDNMYVIYSDAPYITWSSRMIVGSNIGSDDIGAVIAMPGKIGVLWSNQKQKRFGFKTHLDGANVTSWSSNEVPASQSAVNVGFGMADDHLNMAVATDGTLYCAVKTGYENSNYPEIALLKRQPNGSWDNLYQVATQGTRPIVILNESIGKLRVVYTDRDGGGNILYRESSVNNISFGSQHTLISGSYNNSTSSKGNFTSEVVILASSTSQAVGVLASDGSSNSLPETPILISPEDNETNVALIPTLSWNSAFGASTYTIQVSETTSFSNPFFSQSNLTQTTSIINNLSANTTYYWRVRATNNVGNSSWSNSRKFTTQPNANVEPLVLHLKFEEASGNLLSDESSYTNNATSYNNPTWINDAYGNYLRFNGINQYCTIGDHTSLNITQEITISMWIKPEKVDTQYLIKKALNNSVDGYELALASSGKAFFRFNQNTSGNNFRLDTQSSYPIDGNTWMHLAVTFNGSTIKIFVNGIQDNSTTLSSTQWINVNQLPLWISSENNGVRGFQGAIDEVYMFNKALSSTEVYDLYTERPAQL